MKYTMTDAAGVFGNTNFTGIEVPVFQGFEKHPLLAPQIPFVFRTDFLTVFITLLRQIVAKHGTSAPRRGAYLGGPAGCGKTTALEQAFSRVGLPVGSLTVSPQFDIAEALWAKEIVGGDIQQRDGILLLAAKAGFPVIINEISKTSDEKLALIYDLIDRGQAVLETGEKVVGKGAFSVWATDNTMGQGDTSINGGNPGANVMSDAMLDRFVMTAYDYADEAAEQEIIEKAVSAVYPKFSGHEAAKITRTVVEAGRMIRTAVPGTCSTRKLIDWCMSTVEIAKMMKEAMSAGNGGIFAKTDPLEAGFNQAVANGIADPASLKAAREAFTVAVENIRKRVAP